MPRTILWRAKLVVGGHASAMRALRHGVPIVAIPRFAGDQPDVAAAAIRRTIRRAAA
jgi:UDP:flavonoid glycosyltransferase YjiC (YdhE family)